MYRIVIWSVIWSVPFYNWNSLNLYISFDKISYFSVETKTNLKLMKERNIQKNRISIHQMFFIKFALNSECLISLKVWLPIKPLKLPSGPKRYQNEHIQSLWRIACDLPAFKPFSSHFILSFWLRFFDDYFYAIVIFVLNDGRYPIWPKMNLFIDLSWVVFFRDFDSTSLCEIFGYLFLFVHPFYVR